MTDDEKLEFRTDVSQNASEIVKKLMQSGLGPIDSAFCLGSSLKLISGIMVKFENISQADAQAPLLEAFNAGFANTDTEIIIAS